MPVLIKEVQGFEDFDLSGYLFSSAGNFTAEFGQGAGAARSALSLALAFAAILRLPCRTQNADSRSLLKQMVRGSPTEFSILGGMGV